MFTIISVCVYVVLVALATGFRLLSTGVGRKMLMGGCALLILVMGSGCSVTDTKCIVPGCAHKHSTRLSFTVEEAAKKITYGESNVTVEQWVRAWSPESVEEVDMVLSHIRFYVAKERKGLDVDYRKAEWSDKNMNWSSDKTKRFVYNLNK